MLRRTLTLILFFSLLVLPVGPRTRADAPLPPVQMPEGWWAGATPPGASPSSPVLVFVAGLHQPATSWWGPTRYHGNNDMYGEAYRRGLRTAFVEMGGGAGGDMWENGRSLAGRLTAITQYYGVAQVTLITHSKGGVDANTAAAYFGAAPRIAAVISLSSPNWGSPLADLAMSRWGGWLATLVGERDAGVRCLQAGYMQWFRSATDGRPDDASVPYYTISGTGWGPPLSALYMGGLYLSAWGPNDGMVPEVSGHKPGGLHVQTLALDHDAMRTAQAWPALADALAAGGGVEAAAPSPLPFGPGAVLRGGVARGIAAVAVPVEGGARRAEFYVLTSDAVAVTAVGPDGRRYPMLPQAEPPEVFSGARLNAVALRTPAAGNWRVEIQGKESTGYLVMAQIDSPALAALRLPSGLLAPGGQVRLGFTLSPGLIGAQLRASVSLAPAAPSRAPTGFATAAEAPGALAFEPATGAALALPGEAGVYPLAVTLSGRLRDGTPFERSFATSLAVAPPGLAPPG